MFIWKHGTLEANITWRLWEKQNDSHVACSKLHDKPHKRKVKGGDQIVYQPTNRPTPPCDSIAIKEIATSYRTAQKTRLEILNHLYLDKCRSLNGRFCFSILSCRLEGCRRPSSTSERPEGGARPAPRTDKRGSPPLCLPRYQPPFFDRFKGRVHLPAFTVIWEV